MYYNKFQDKELSALGLGCMRLPLLEDGQIDEEQVFQMVKTAADHGINYFDTAWPYHGGLSEIVIGKALKQLPRESFYLATKYPGHQIAETYNPAETFDEQLEKCGVDYFDFYLLHNINENSIDTYMDEKWGMVDYFVEQKKLGRIKHLGFSTHAHMPSMKRFIEKYGDDMEFCQIQLNYLDWTLQSAKEKYEYLTEKNIPVWVMEPLRGGKLVDDIELSFRFLQALPNVTMILSGMSNMDQLLENMTYFEENKGISEEDCAMLLEKAEAMKDSIPCTACRYCVEGCPMGLDIPELIKQYNEMRVMPTMNIGMNIDGLPEDKRPSACIACGKCSRSCPQNIDIPKAMRDFTTELEKFPHWVDICRERAEAEAAKKKNK